MSAINKLLNEAKEKAGIKSDNALALEMGITRQSMSQTKKGKSAFGAYARQRLADLTGRDIKEINALIEIETETDETKRKYWENFYKRLGGVAASILATVILMVTLPAQNTDALTILASGQCILC